MSAIERWRKLLPQFEFAAAIENLADAQALAGLHGRVDDAVRAHCPALEGHEVYCCGAPPMVVAVKKVCVGERGLSPELFFSDVFVAGPAAAAA
jgi:terephthalate 1,2-dioxygenase reductase component